MLVNEYVHSGSQRKKTYRKGLWRKFCKQKCVGANGLQSYCERVHESNIAIAIDISVSVKKIGIERNVHSSCDVVFTPATTKHDLNNECQPYITRCEPIFTFGIKTIQICDELISPSRDDRSSSIIVDLQNPFQSDI